MSLAVAGCWGANTDPAVSRMDLRDNQGHVLDTVTVYRDTSGQEYYYEDGIRRNIDNTKESQ